MKMRALPILAAVGAALSAPRQRARKASRRSRSPLIVPFPAGGGSDILSRIVAERMKVTLGQPVIIENVGGAGGTIGTAGSPARRLTATPSASANGPRMSAPARSIR